MRLGLIIFSLLITPTITLANIEITEIMYDLQGSDSKREWIELYNGGNEPIDITDWRFFDGSNHTLVGDDLVIGAQEFALLVSDIETYGAGANIFDTVMSLTNTSKTISILDADGLEADSVTYFMEWGASGNGNSLQLVNGEWIEASPTPLQLNAGVSPDERDDEPLEEEITAEETEEEKAVEESYATHFVSNIKANAGEDREGVVSALMFFEGEAFGLQDKPLKNAKYVWNFGDGKSAEGKNVSHTYSYVGKYIVSLNVSSGEHSASDSLVVSIGEADLEIISADRGKIEIANNSNKELELSFWSIKFKDKYFTFPKGTFVLPKHTATFPVSVTMLPIDSLNDVELLYPNGLIAGEFLSQPLQEPSKEVIKKEVVEYVYVTKKIVEPNIEEEESGQEDASTTQAMSQSALVTESSESQNMYKWLVALISLISVASLVAISSKAPKGASKKSSELKADDFKIIE